ncbi:MAG: amino acid permease [Desulfurococcales archaeon]|nr:amino acid permease [Desulfurococcales archaeon]
MPKPTGGKDRIGFKEAFSIGVGGMIGGGIFAVLGLSLQLAGTGAPISFLIAGLVALLSAYSYSKLTMRFPSRGGTVEFLVRGFGPGILAGGLNILLIVSYTVMIALYAYAFGSYGASVFSGGWILSHVLATLVIIAFTLVNALGGLVSGRVEDVLVGFKLVVLIFVVAVGVRMVAWSKFSPESWPPISNIVVGGMVIFLAYEGFELIANAAGEASSLRDLSKAYYASVVTVTGVYIAIALVSAGILSPAEVIRVRDYALAEVACLAVGSLGFYIVVAAALASTASAINATLYGTAGISYVVARYGELPRAMARVVWREAPEGLIVISLISLALVNGEGLDAIAFAGSAGFLVIFSMVNLAAFRLRRQAKANPVLTILGFSSSLAALALLIYHSMGQSLNQVLLFMMLLSASFIAEFLYRKFTGRRIAHYIDKRLAERERLKKEWHVWVPRVIEALGRLLKEFEVYLVGGIARGEIERSHDVDLLVVVSEKVEAEDLEERIVKLTGLKGHPLHIHVTTPEDKEKWLRRSVKYRKLEDRRA